MKSFKKFVTEDSGFPTGPVGENPNNLGGDLENAPTDIANPAVLKRINAIIGQIGKMEYLMPEHAINRLKGAMNKIGLDFGMVPAMEGTSGKFDLPLSRFGGRFGKDENTPYDEFVNDDGISHMVEGGLSLKIEYEMMPRNQSCRVFASIS